MEDDPKIKMKKYLSNHWSGLSKIKNINLSDQVELSKYFKWKWTPTNDDHKISKVEYLIKRETSQ